MCPKLIELLSWNGPTVHVCCLMLARTFTKTFVSRIHIRQPSPKTAKNFRQPKNSLAGSLVSRGITVLVFYHELLCNYLNTTLQARFYKNTKMHFSFDMSVPVRLSVRMEHFGSHWTDFHEIMFDYFRKSVQKIKFSLTCAKSNGFFT